jgi:type II secretory pathway pseudopilin PulG
MIRFSRRSGFSLPAVLAVTGMVSLIFLVAMTALRSLTAEAASARARVQFMARAMTMEASAAYMVATEPMSPMAIDVGAPRRYDDAVTGSGSNTDQVRLDGRPYLVEARPPLIIEFRDQAGLINLAYLSEDGVRRLAAELGVPDRTSRLLAGRYRDYVDQDELEQASGGEGAAYPDGRPPNRTMRTPNEWLSLLGVRDAVDPAAWRRLRPWLAMDPTSTNENINTAGPEALRILYGATPGQISTALRQREDAPFLSFQNFSAATGLPNTSGESFYTFPSGRVILTLKDTRSAWIYRSRLTLTPTGLERPVWIDQTEMTEAPRRAVADASDAVRLSYAPR